MEKKKTIKKERTSKHGGSSQKTLTRLGCQPDQSNVPQDLYSLIADLSYNWEYLIAPNRSFIYVSPSCEQITGYSAQDFLNAPDLINQIVHPDDKNKVLHHLDCINADPIHKPFEFRIVSKSGEVRWISHTCRPVFDKNGHLIGRRASNQDVTDKALLEQTLYQRETLFRTLFENTDSCIAVYTVIRDGQEFLFKEFNKAAEDSSQLKRKNVIGKNVQDVFPGVEEMGLLDVFKRVYSTGIAESHPFTQYSDNRIDLYVENYVYKLPSGEIVTIYHDKTVEKNIQEELRISRERIQLAIDSVSDALWDWSIPTGKAYFSPPYFTMLGYEPDEFEHNLESWEKLVHPDDLSQAKELIEEAMQRREQFEIEFRMKRKDGNWHWVLGRGRIVESDENGHPKRMVGTHVDIHQRVRFESRLELNQKVFDEAIEGIVITDSDGTILFTNKAFATISGYSPEEAIGQNPRILKSDHHDSEFYKGLWDSLVNSGAWRGEIWNRRKNGEVYPQWTSITSVRNRCGTNRRYVAVFHDVSDMKMKDEQIEHMAYHDPLTGLPNRMLLKDRLRQAILDAKRKREMIQVLFIDLDNFKKVNDAIGHVRGDQLLKEAAGRISATIRSSDTVSRIGGDEFVIISCHIKNKEEIAVLVERVQTSFQHPFFIKEHSFHVTCSIGIAMYPDDGEDAETLIRNADLAMYQSKYTGKNIYSTFTKEMADKVKARVRLEAEMQDAIERGEFQVYFQPRVDLKTFIPKGVEALVRWIKPDGAIISPFDFIPIAEESGLILPLGGIIFKKALEGVARVHKKTGIDISVSINVSAKQFEDNGFITMVEDLISETGFPSRNIEIEITESLLVQDIKAATQKLKALADMGIMTAIDDFGTGYSSLAYIKKLPISVLKIDKSFIDDLSNDSEDKILVETIVLMANKLNISIVAEGVETLSQLTVLKEMGNMEIQGYLFSPPMPEDNLVEWMRNKAYKINC